MTSPALQDDSDDGMDEFMEKFKAQKYKNAFNESNWEEEFDKVPMFMKKAPDVIDPVTHPDLACLQSIIHDDDRPPEEQAQGLKDEGNEFFKEKNYKKAVISYTAGLKIKCTNQDINTILLTNRAAAHFHLGNMRSALNDAVAAKKIKPDHLKALTRGAQCCMELRNFAEAIQWCDAGLRAHPTDQKLLQIRAEADKQKRAAERDARKAKANEKKKCGERDALLAAIKERGIKLLQPKKPPKHGSDSEDEERGSVAAIAELTLDGLSSQDATGARVYMDEQGSLHWPVLFLYPEHQQSDFISAFCESSCFINHLAVMFGEELPPWDVQMKYLPQNLELYFEGQKEILYQVDPKTSLLEVLRHERYFVKAGTPSFIILVKGSSFCKQFLTGKKVKRLGK